MLTRYVLIFCFVFLSCDDDEKKDHPHEATTLPEEEIVVAPTTGEVETTEETPQQNTPSKISLKNAGSLDLRPDAPRTATQPTTTPLDPRTHSPSGTYNLNGKISRNVFEGQVAVSDDGRSHIFPACTTPLPAPGLGSTAGITVDGNDSEWNDESIVLIDKFSDSHTSDTDLHSIRWARDGSNIFMSFEMAGNWTSETTGNVGINFSAFALTLPVDNSTAPAVGATRHFQIRGNTLWEYTSSWAELTKGTGAGEVDFDVSYTNNIVEFRIETSEIEGTVGTGPYGIKVYSWNGYGGIYDDVGTHYVGLIDDYACLVNLPDTNGTFDNYKMFVFRRTDASIPADEAELHYRAFIAAAPAVERVAKDNLNYWDTIAFSVIKNMSAAGLYQSFMSIFMKNGITNAFGEANEPTYLFKVAAHEYAHIFNATDYVLPEEWMTEGHSDWVAADAISHYYGKSTASLFNMTDFNEFLAEEDEHGIQTIADANWGDAPYSGLFYYYKSHSYYRIMNSLVDAEAFRTSVVQNTNHMDKDDFLNAYKGLSSYPGSGSEDLESGWFGGSYSSPLIYKDLLNDDDFDGLRNFEDSNDNDADNDGDNQSDWFEKTHGFSSNNADSVNYLAIDNQLSDWDALIPDTLSEDIASSNSDSACEAHSRIQRYGFIYTEGWLIAAIELQSLPPAAANLTVAVSKNSTGGTIVLQALYGTNYVFGQDIATRHQFAPISFNGKTLEIAFNASWLGWTDGTFPSGESFNLSTHVGATQCDVSMPRTPTQNL